MLFKELCIKLVKTDKTLKKTFTKVSKSEIQNKKLKILLKELESHVNEIGESFKMKEQEFNRNLRKSFSEKSLKLEEDRNEKNQIEFQELTKQLNSEKNLVHHLEKSLNQVMVEKEEAKVKFKKELQVLKSRLSYFEKQLPHFQIDQLNSKKVEYVSSPPSQKTRLRIDLDKLEDDTYTHSRFPKHHHKISKNFHLPSSPSSPKLNSTLSPMTHTSLASPAIEFRKAGLEKKKTVMNEKHDEKPKKKPDEDTQSHKMVVNLGGNKIKVKQMEEQYDYLKREYSKLETMKHDSEAKFLNLLKEHRQLKKQFDQKLLLKEEEYRKHSEINEKAKEKLNTLIFNLQNQKSEIEKINLNLKREISLLQVKFDFLQSKTANLSRQKNYLLDTVDQFIGNFAAEFQKTNTFFFNPVGNTTIITAKKVYEKMNELNNLVLNSFTHTRDIILFMNFKEIIDYAIESFSPSENNIDHIVFEAKMSQTPNILRDQNSKTSESKVFDLKLKEVKDFKEGMPEDQDDNCKIEESQNIERIGKLSESMHVKSISKKNTKQAFKRSKFSTEPNEIVSDVVGKKKVPHPPNLPPEGSLRKRSSSYNQQAIVCSLGNPHTVHTEEFKGNENQSMKETESEEDGHETTRKLETEVEVNESYSPSIINHGYPLFFPFKQEQFRTLDMHKNQDPNTLSNIYRERPRELIYTTIVLIEKIFQKYNIEINEHIRQFVKSDLESVIDMECSNEILSRFFLMSEVQLDQLIMNQEKEIYDQAIKNKELQNQIELKNEEITNLKTINGERKNSFLGSQVECDNEIRKKMEDALMKKLTPFHSHQNEKTEEEQRWLELFQSTKIFHRMKDMIIKNQLNKILSNIRLQSMEQILISTKNELSKKIRELEQKNKEIVDEKNIQIKTLKNEFKANTNELEQMFLQQKMMGKKKFLSKLKQQAENSAKRIKRKIASAKENYENQIKRLESEKKELKETVKKLENEIEMLGMNKTTKSKLEGFENTFSLTFNLPSISKEQVLLYLKTYLKIDVQYLRLISIKKLNQRAKSKNDLPSFQPNSLIPPGSKSGRRSSAASGLSAKTTESETKSKSTLTKFEFELLGNQEKVKKSYLSRLRSSTYDQDCILTELKAVYLCLNVGKLYLYPDYSLKDFDLIHRSTRFIDGVSILITLLRHREGLCFKVLGLDLENHSDFSITLEIDDVHLLCDGNHQILEKENEENLKEVILNSLGLLEKDESQILICEKRCFFNLNKTGAAKTEQKEKEIIEKIQKEKFMIGKRYQKALYKDQNVQTKIEENEVFEKTRSVYNASKKIDSILFSIEVLQAEKSKNVFFKIRENSSISHQLQPQINALFYNEKIEESIYHTTKVFAQNLYLDNNDVLLVSIEETYAPKGFVVRMKNNATKMNDKLILAWNSKNILFEVSQFQFLDEVQRKELFKLAYGFSFQEDHLPTRQTSEGKTELEVSSRHNLSKKEVCRGIFLFRKERAIQVTVKETHLKSAIDCNIILYECKGEILVTIYPIYADEIISNMTVKVSRFEILTDITSALQDDKIHQYEDFDTYTDRMELEIDKKNNSIQIHLTDESSLSETSSYISSGTKLNNFYSTNMMTNANQEEFIDKTPFKKTKMFINGFLYEIAFYFLKKNNSTLMWNKLLLLATHLKTSLQKRLIFNGDRLKMVLLELADKNNEDMKISSGEYDIYDPDNYEEICNILSDSLGLKDTVRCKNDLVCSLEIQEMKVKEAEIVKFIMMKNGSHYCENLDSGLESYKFIYTYNKRKILVNEELQIDEATFDIKVYEQSTFKKKKYIFTCHLVKSHQLQKVKSQSIQDEQVKDTELKSNSEEEYPNTLKGTPSQQYKKETYQKLIHSCEFSVSDGKLPTKLLIEEVKMKEDDISQNIQEDERKDRKEEDQHLGHLGNIEKMSVLFRQYNPQNMLLCIYENSFPHYIIFSIFQPFTTVEWTYKVEDFTIYKLNSWEFKQFFTQIATQFLFFPHNDVQHFNELSQLYKEDIPGLALFEIEPETIELDFESFWKMNEEEELNLFLQFKKIFSKILPLDEQSEIEFCIYSSNFKFFYFTIKKIDTALGTILHTYEISMHKSITEQHEGYLQEFFSLGKAKFLFILENNIPQMFRVDGNSVAHLSMRITLIRYLKPNTFNTIYQLSILEKNCICSGVESHKKYDKAIKSILNSSASIFYEYRMELQYIRAKFRPATVSQSNKLSIERSSKGTVFSENLEVNEFFELIVRETYEVPDSNDVLMVSIFWDKNNMQVRDLTLFFNIFDPYTSESFNETYNLLKIFPHFFMEYYNKNRLRSKFAKDTEEDDDMDEDEKFEGWNEELIEHLRKKSEELLKEKFQVLIRHDGSYEVKIFSDDNVALDEKDEIIEKIKGLRPFLFVECEENIGSLIADRKKKSNYSQYFVKETKAFAGEDDSGQFKVEIYVVDSATNLLYRFKIITKNDFRLLMCADLPEQTLSKYLTQKARTFLLQEDQKEELYKELINHLNITNIHHLEVKIL